MLKIRLQRVGRTHEPTFRVVLTDSKNSNKSGRLLEILGSHDPRHKELTKLEGEKIKYWISKGAKPTPTLHNMFISKKIMVVNLTDTLWLRQRDFSIIIRVMAMHLLNIPE